MILQPEAKHVLINQLGVTAIPCMLNTGVTDSYGFAIANSQQQQSRQANHAITRKQSFQTKSEFFQCIFEQTSISVLFCSYQT